MAEFKPTVPQLIEVLRYLSETRLDNPSHMPAWVAEHNIYHEQFYGFVADALSELYSASEGRQK